MESCLGSAKHILQPRDRDLPFEHGTKVARPQRLEWCDGVQLGVDRLVLKNGRSQYVKDLRQWLMLWVSLRLSRPLPTRRMRHVRNMHQDICGYGSQKKADIRRNEADVGSTGRSGVEHATETPKP